MCPGAKLGMVVKFDELWEGRKCGFEVTGKVRCNWTSPGLQLPVNGKVGG